MTTRHIELDGSTFGIELINGDGIEANEYQVADLINAEKDEYLDLGTMTVAKSDITAVGHHNALQAALKKHVKAFYAS